jgi:hypothetical protein
VIVPFHMDITFGWPPLVEGSALKLVTGCALPFTVIFTVGAGIGNVDVGGFV